MRYRLLRVTENSFARHIVVFGRVAIVRGKLKAVNETLKEFVGESFAVDTKPVDHQAEGTDAGTHDAA